MMKFWAALGALIGATIAVAAHAPATWVAGVLATLPGSRVQLVDARGTLWHGDALLVVGEGARSPDARALPGRVTWSLGWSDGAPQLALRAECCMLVAQHVRWVPGWGVSSASLSDGSSQWPAAVLSALGAPWNTVQVEGALRVQTRGVSVEWSDGRARLAGQIVVDGLGMASRLSTLRPVGSYRLTLAGGSGLSPPTVNLQTLEGPLRLEGRGEWKETGWGFSGEASAEPASESALGNLLNMLGRRQGNKSLLSLG